MLNNKYEFMVENKTVNLLLENTLDLCNRLVNIFLISTNSIGVINKDNMFLFQRSYLKIF